MDYILVGIGGAAGAILRYAASRTFNEITQGSFPVGTIVVNVTGAFLLCLLVGSVVNVGILIKEVGLALTVGFLGSYTTFSTFSYETVKLIQDGEIAPALSCVLITVVLGLIAAWLGIQTSIYLSGRGLF